MNVSLTQPGLLLPTRDDARVVALTLLTGGVVFDKMFTRLCPQEEATRFLYVDLTSYQGQEIGITVSESDSAHTEPEGKVWPYDLLEQQITPAEPPMDTPAQAAMRPKLHFTTRTGWSNDPCGACFYDGLYHLCYQYFPGSVEPVWDNAHWGHAVSRDLLHWQECEPVVRHPHASSGSAFVRRETGKLCIAWLTSIAESTDGFYFRPDEALTREKGCDPQIFWHEESGQYVSIDLNYNDAKERYEDYHVSVSPDLKNWTLTDRLTGWFECPNLTKLPVEGTDEHRWVLFGGDMAYQIGSFDGQRFCHDPLDPDRRDGYRAVTPRGGEPEYTNKYNGQWAGFNAYACQVFSEMEGRVLRAGWYLIDFAGQGMPFNQCMILPQELSLRKTAFGLRLCVEPVRELQQLRGTETLLQSNGTFERTEGATWEFCAELCPGSVLTVNEFTFENDGEQLLVRQDCAQAIEIPLPTPGAALPLRGVTDIGCFEVYADLGELYLPLRPKRFEAGLALSLAGNTHDRVSIYPLEI